MIFFHVVSASNKQESVSVDISYPGARRRARYYCLGSEQGQHKSFGVNVR